MMAVFRARGTTGMEGSPTIPSDFAAGITSCGDLEGIARGMSAEGLAQAANSAKSSLWNS